MVGLTKKKWRSIQASVYWIDRLIPQCPRAVDNIETLFKEAKRLRAENESLKIEFAGIDCEHRAEVMAKLREENEILQKNHR